MLSTSASAHVEFIFAVLVWICSGLTPIGKQLLLMLGRVVVWDIGKEGLEVGVVFPFRDMCEEGGVAGR